MPLARATPPRPCHTPVHLLHHALARPSTCASTPLPSPAQADREQAEFEAEWKELGKMIEQDRKMKEFMKKEREKMTMQEHRGEMSMPAWGSEPWTLAET